MKKRTFRKFEWNAWKLLDCRILLQIPLGFWDPLPWGARLAMRVDEPPSENSCLRVYIYIYISSSHTRVNLHTVSHTKKKSKTKCVKKYFQRAKLHVHHIYDISLIHCLSPWTRIGSCVLFVIEIRLTK